MAVTYTEITMDRKGLRRYSASNSGLLRQWGVWDLAIKSYVAKYRTRRDAENAAATMESERLPFSNECWVVHERKPAQVMPVGALWMRPQGFCSPRFPDIESAESYAEVLKNDSEISHEVTLF